MKKNFFSTINFIFFLVVLTKSSLLQAQNYNEIIKMVASDREASDLFGFSVAISGDYAVVGAYVESEDADGFNTLSGAGSVYIFENDGSENWSEVQKLTASDRDIDDFFGNSVSISGNYAIVGAPSEDEDSEGMNTLNAAGSAYVYERDVSGNWSEVQKLVSLDRGSSDVFGSSVAISGNYAIVGAPSEDEDTEGMNTLSVAGSAYIFERDESGNWVESQKLIASDRDQNDTFGHSVAISGNHVIVGAWGEDEDADGMSSVTNSGSAYLFEQDEFGSWIEVEKLVASDRASSDNFGFSVAISSDYAIVGAFTEDEDDDGVNSLTGAGSAYLFERDGMGNWTEVQKLVASDREENDNAGYSVSISGNYAIVGAFQEDEDEDGLNTLSRAGSAYIFGRTGSGSWDEIQKLSPSDRGSNDQFGFSVAISDDNVIVGAFTESEDSDGLNTLTSAGSSYIFFSEPNPPIFTSATISSIEENILVSQIILDIQANDGDGGESDANITYAISGIDAAVFSLDSDDGELRFSSSPDFENPLDEGG